MTFLYFNYNKNLNYTFIYWALEIIHRSLIYFKWDIFQIFKKDSVNEYYFVVLQNLSFFFSGFLVLYIHYSLKKKSNDESQKAISNKLEIELILEERPMKFKITKNIIYKIILGSALNYLNRLASFIFYQANPDVEHKKIFHKVQYDIINNIDILMRFLLSIIVFKIKLYKHHFLSFVIAIIGFIVFIFNDFFSINYSEDGTDKKLTYIYIGILSYRGILYPLEDSIAKKVFIDYYILPEHYFFLEPYLDFCFLLY